MDKSITLRGLLRIGTSLIRSLSSRAALHVKQGYIDDPRKTQEEMEKRTLAREVSTRRKRSISFMLCGTME